MRLLLQRLSFLSVLFTLLILSGPFGCDDTTTIVVTCGDGFLDTGEECDDGNEANGDACENDCTLPTCGNSILDQGEICDGNCPASCSQLGCQLQNLEGEECTRECVTAGLVDACDMVSDGCCPTGCDAESDADCQAACGNNVTETGEECDDGNADSTDNCVNCKLSVCGDGAIDLSAPGIEQCDDGNLIDTDNCRSNCTPATCGDNVVDAAAPGIEACDPGAVGAFTSTCDADCTAPSCGDGLANLPAGEECDGGGSQSDLCETTCDLPECGDGVTNLSVGEECDDANGSNTDACLNNCKNAFCGDNFVQASVETCDDGNTLNEGNGCSATCQRNDSCGNGIVESLFEACDDGNQADNGNGCSATCTRLGVCGDGVVQALFEDCDDGDTIAGANGCSAVCTRLGACGDGVIQILFEECDDMNAVETDDCRNNCLLNVCGDGAIDSVGLRTDTCDDGNSSNNDNCVNLSGQCRPSSCPDGFVDVQAPGIEQCDDGNTTNDDACSNACVSADCGDGVLQTGEDCDDGNVITEASCPYGEAVCTLCDSACQEVAETGNVCGDGVVDPDGHEVCDDGNSLACGTCDEACQVVTSAAATGFIIAVAGSEIVDGETFTVSDGQSGPVIFEFDVLGDGASNVPVTISSASTPAQVANAIATAIDGEGMLINTQVVGGTNLVSLVHQVNTSLGNVTITETVTSGSFSVIGMSGGAGGDCPDGDGCATGADCASGNCAAFVCEP